MVNLIVNYAELTVFMLWITWVWFSAVMRWRELRDQGKLDSKHLLVRWCIYANLVIGLLFDALCNVLVSPIMLELPQWQHREFLLTYRLIRWHHSTDTGWWTVHVRQNMVALGQQLLDVVDTDGIHIT